MPVINENGTPQESAAPQGHIYDMIIVGGGPGPKGIPAVDQVHLGAHTGQQQGVRRRAVAAAHHRHGLAPVEHQMALTEQVDNYPGFDEGVDGFTLGEKMRRGAERFGVPTRMGISSATTLFQQNSTLSAAIRGAW